MATLSVTTHSQPGLETQPLLTRLTQEEAETLKAAALSGAISGAIFGILSGAAAGAIVAHKTGPSIFALTLIVVPLSGATAGVFGRIELWEPDSLGRRIVAGAIGGVFTAAFITLAATTELNLLTYPLICLGGGALGAVGSACSKTFTNIIVGGGVGAFLGNFLNPLGYNPLGYLASTVGGFAAGALAASRLENRLWAVLQNRRITQPAEDSNL